MVASVDCSAAFDSISHDILLRKLERSCGIQGTALSLMQTYLEGRMQRTKLSGDRVSEWMPIKSGVPQGSVLGPLLFSLYTADIGHYVTAAKLVVFADDITLVVSDKDAAKTKHKMNLALSQVARFARCNRIAPEPSKTQLLVSAGHKQLGEMKELACEMGEHNIQPKDAIKVLGVLLDNQLSWEPHNAAAAKKAENAIWAVARAAHHLSMRERGILIKSLALPHLDYCQNATAGASAHANQTVRNAYNRAARTARWGLSALHTRRTEKGGEVWYERLPSITARKGMRWNTWEQRRAGARAAITMKIFETGRPEVLRDLLPQVCDALLRDRKLRGHSLGCVPQNMTGRNNKFAEKAFSHWGPRVINAVARDAIFEGCGDPMEERTPAPAGKDKKPPRPPPSDEEEITRNGWYSFLKTQYANVMEHSKDDEVLVWTDGSSITTPHGDRAGAGIFYGYRHPGNKSLHVPGDQTCARAELYALLHVLRHERRNIHVKSDCRYVVDGFNTFRQKWKSNAWMDKPLEGIPVKHADLWREVDCLMQNRVNPCSVAWTKGHPLPKHLSANQTTEIDAFGNIGADFLAGAASGSSEFGNLIQSQARANAPPALFPHLQL